MNQADDSEQLARLESLLIKDATEGLSASEEDEIASLLEKYPGFDAATFETAAAATHLAFLSALPNEPMPAGLQRRLAERGRAWMDNQRADTREEILGHSPGDEFAFCEALTHLSQAEPQPASQCVNTDSKSAGLTGPRLRLFNLTGWIVAASLLVVLLAFPRSEPSSTEENESLSLTQRRSALVAQPNTLVMIWTDGPTPLGVKTLGDVVWNQRTQQGFMSFEGLPANDPNREQYQLWIIDPGRDTHPIDGGVFDIVGSGTNIVPINAKLGVVNPQAFAITIEKPGGVVVSDQERLPLIASVPLQAPAN